MNPDRERRAAALFDAASDCDQEQRRRLLESACAGDDALRAEVEALLDADTPESAEFPHPLQLDRLFPAQESRTGLEAGARVGRFVVSRLIAVGGMGVVYEAEQDHPRRTVALKLMRFGATSPAAIRRFENEARTLGRFRHPNIAQVFDAGIHDVGDGPIPWIAMEFIDGARDIVSSAGAQDLDTRARIGLFLQACDAVVHAHHNGVIHRDLKPSNILVDRESRVTVIDFGIAQATDLGAAATLHGEAGGIMGTLRYMSPEQLGAESRDVDGRSDVYSLGVVLYELLCGRPMCAIDGLGLFEASRRIKEAIPPRPSALNPRVRGDLETIILTATEKDRTARYVSPVELAEDLRRWLGHQPIAARPPSPMYRLRTFTRRNRGLVGGLVAIFGILVAALSVVSRQTLQLQRQARGNAEVISFLESMLIAAAANPLWSDESADRRFGAATLWSQVIEDSARRLDSTALSDPRADAAIRHHLGVARNWLGHYDDAAASLEAAWKTRRRLLGDDHPDTLSSQAGLAFAKVFLLDSLEAIRLAEDAVEGLGRGLGRSHVRTLDAMTTLMLAQNYAGFVADLDRTAGQAIELAGADPSLRGPRTIAKNFRAMASLLFGRIEEAEGLARGVLDELGTDAEPSIAGGQAHILLGMIALRRSEFDLAESELREGMAQWDSRTGRSMLEFPMVLAEVLVRQPARRAEGLTLVDATIDEARRRHGPHHPYTSIVAGRAMRVLEIAGEVDARIRLDRQLVAMWKQGGHVPQIRHAGVLRDLSMALAESGQGDEAYASMLSALRLAEQFPDELWARVPGFGPRTIRRDLARLCERLGREDEASRWRSGETRGLPQE